ncbi:MAG: PspC domain-containing protein [Dehalococcoidia bacterium]|nr:PspC domain-containing protein [Dehalococcoidia bacterium]
MDRLYRSSDQRMVAGVLGGFGEYFGVDPTIIRVIFVIVTIATGFLLGIVAYLVLWLIIPSEDAVDRPIRDSMRQNVEEMAQSARNLGSEVQATLSREGRAEERRDRLPLLGLILIVAGVLFLLSSLDLLRWFYWGRFWPLLLIIIGVFLLMRRR